MEYQAAKKEEKELSLSDFLEYMSSEMMVRIVEDGIVCHEGKVKDVPLALINQAIIVSENSVHLDHHILVIPITRMIQRERQYDNTVCLKGLGR